MEIEEVEIAISTPAIWYRDFHSFSLFEFDPSLHFVGVLCCLHVLKPFLVLPSCSAFRPQECQ